MIASIFELDNEHDVSDYSNSIIRSFGSDVLPFCFGFNSLNGEDLIRHHTTVTTMSTKENLSLDKKKFLSVNHSLFVQPMATLLTCSARTLRIEIMWIS